MNPIVKILWRDLAEAENRSGMRVGMPRVAVDVSHLEYVLTAFEILDQERTWQPMEAAPRDGTIIEAWCVHEADPYYEVDGKRLTPYGTYCEGGERVPDGPCFVQWRDGERDYDEWSGKPVVWPDWWFEVGRDLEVVANPVLWRPFYGPTEGELKPFMEVSHGD